MQEMYFRGFSGGGNQTRVHCFSSIHYVQVHIENSREGNPPGGGGGGGRGGGGGDGGRKSLCSPPSTKFFAFWYM